MRPDQIIDLLALMGDSVDNIPGVEKCGPKTAAKWLGEYGTLETSSRTRDKVSGKIGENLRAALGASAAVSGSWRRSRPTSPLELEPHDLRLRERDAMSCASCTTATNSRRR